MQTVKQVEIQDTQQASKRTLKTKGISKDTEDFLTTGLSEVQAASKLIEFGSNLLTQKKKSKVMALVLAQFGDVMVLLLAAATLASALMGDYVEAIAIATIIGLNAVLGFFQEFRTQKTLEALKKLAAPETTVVRGGKIKKISAEKIVPGDVVLLEAGERAPADGLVYKASGLRADESMLTGESIPLTKLKNDKIFMGTLLVSGNGAFVVQTTGMNTEMGAIAGLLESVEANETPLQARLEKMGKIIAFGCVMICLVVVGLGVLRGEPLFDMLLSGISLAVAAVPEGLPAVVSVALAIGVRRMLLRKALVRRLPAVETLGCATVICSDKTGTITQNKMVIRKVYSAGKVFDIMGKGVQGKEIQEIARLGVLCCNIRLSKVGSKIKSIVTDPTENAFVELAQNAGVPVQEHFISHQRIHEIPFDSDKKRMTVLCKDKDGRLWAIMKGGCDVVLERCQKIKSVNIDVQLEKNLRISVLAFNNSMASEALRVLAVACKQLDMNEDEWKTYVSRNSSNEEEIIEKLLENDLTFVGLVGMIDPPREEAIEAIKCCKEAGIRTVMITGDHRDTAVAVAKETGIIPKDIAAYSAVLTGEQIDKMDDEFFSRELERTNVFARVSPRHKLRIVKTLKEHGHVVAMTGDGVNDAPAVSEADIGVAMGRDGTEVTREAAAMVLLDDNFATITAAVEEGRVIYSNIRKFIRYLLACNFGEVFTVFVTMLIGLPLPLLPIQLLWVNLVTDGLPALALGFDPPSKEIMSFPPRKKEESIFSGGLGYLIFSRGLLIGVCTVGIFIYALNVTANVNIARTAAFVVLVVAQLIHVFECKSEKRTLIRINIFNNIGLIISVLISFGLTIMVVTVPELQAIFRTTALPQHIWNVIMGIAVVIPVAGGFMTWAYFRLVKKLRKLV